MNEPALYHALLGAWFVTAAITFAVLTAMPAPYGRHARAGWGTTPSIGGAAGWLLMESPAALAMALFAATSPRPTATAALLVGLWELHYVYRSFLFPLRRRSPRPMPLAIALTGAAFNVGNAYLNARGLLVFAPPADAPGSPRVLAGVALFGIGFAIHIHSDEALRRLRAPGEGGYRIPNAGLHRAVASPNYLGELLQWIGFAIAAATPAALAFAVWTFANLAPRARAHLRWYRATFPDYPRSRRALVPGIY